MSWEDQVYNEDQALIVDIANRRRQIAQRYAELKISKRDTEEWRTKKDELIKRNNAHLTELDRKVHKIISLQKQLSSKTSEDGILEAWLVREIISKLKRRYGHDTT